MLNVFFGRTLYTGSRDTVYKARSRENSRACSRSRGTVTPWTRDTVIAFTLLRAGAPTSQEHTDTRVYSSHPDLRALHRRWLAMGAQCTRFSRVELFDAFGRCLEPVALLQSLWIAVNRSTLENNYYGKWTFFGNFLGNSQTAKSFVTREFLKYIFEIFTNFFSRTWRLLFLLFSFFFLCVCESLEDRVLEILWNFSLGS